MNELFSIFNLFDLICIATVLLFTLWGLRRGLFGALFGLIRAIVIVGVAIFIIYHTRWQHAAWFQQAFIMQLLSVWVL